MLRPLTSTGVTKSHAALFLQRKERGILTPLKKTRVKDVITTYFSIPTASRVQCFYYACQEEFIDVHASFFEKFLSIVLHGVDKTIDKLSLSRSGYDASFIVPPKELKVSKLPDPPFETLPPPRNFNFAFKPKEIEEYAPPCLMRETIYESPNSSEREADILNSIRKEVLLKGVLKQELASGLVYLYVGSPETLYTKIIPKLFSGKLPYYFHDDYIIPALGIYIPVFLPDEAAKLHNLGLSKELGKEFCFRLEGCYELETSSQDGIEKVWYVTVSAPELECLRTKYVLPPTLDSHGFHIALAMKKREPSKKAAPHTFRLNVSCFAA